MSDTIALPHGLYTVFIDVDPQDGIRSFELAGERLRIFDEWLHSRRFRVPLVQTEIGPGDYRLSVDCRTNSACWQVQIVLNSMRSWSRPPKPWRRRLPLPEPISLGDDRPTSFFIPQTGTYAMDLTIDGWLAALTGTPENRPDEFPSFELQLRSEANTEVIPVARGGGNSMTVPNFTFLGSGEWTVSMRAQCSWGLTIRPMIGPSGGGARWF